MFEAMARVGQWWKNGGGPAGPALPYEVGCACGHVARGYRKAQYQVVPCPVCQHRLFIFPRSPLPPLRSATGDKPAPAPPPPRGWRPWVLPLSAAGVTLVAVVVVLVVVLKSTLFQSVPPPASKTAGRETITKQIRTAKKALGEGDFRLAVQELSAARALRNQQPQVLPREESRHLDQLYRQAVLLEGQEPEPLELILGQWAKLRDRDWQAAFTSNHLGKSIVFDVKLRRDGANQYHLAFPRQVRAVPLRLELQDLKLIQKLAEARFLDNEVHVLFGGRLAGLRREMKQDQPVWTVQFEPDSGVLLTDSCAAAGWAAPQPVEAEVQEVLKRQAGWLTEIEE